MRVDILTLFPEYFSVFDYSIIGRARKNNIVSINTVNIRDYTEDKHKKVDDYPYGGGAGMLMEVQPIAHCIKSVKKENHGPVIFLGPRGEKFSNSLALELSKEEDLIFLCGHYEGIDERTYKYIDREISLGDFVLTGGESAAIPIIDAVLRMVPNVLGSAKSSTDESFYNGLLEYPQYTRPFDYEGEKVPDVLISGHHDNIKKWREEKSKKITRKYRPDLYRKWLKNNS